VNNDEGNFQVAGGLQLHYQRWRPEAGGARAVIVIVHGDFAHSGWYVNLPNYIVPRGYAVYAFDRRGWGRSPGQRGDIAAWDQYLDDIDAFLGLVRSAEPQCPIFLMGHTGSSPIVLEYVLRKRGNLRGVFCVSPVLNPPATLSPLTVWLVGFLSRLAPRLSVNVKRQADATWDFISHDRAFVESTRHDPFANTKVTLRWLVESQAAMRRVNPPTTPYLVPLLILIGTADHLASPAENRAFFQALVASEKDLYEYPDAYTNLLSDTVSDKVLRDIEKWLGRHLDVTIGDG